MAPAATYKGRNLLELEPEDRARSGLFMSFQSPVEVPGVSNAEFLRISANARRLAQGLPELDPLEFYGFITPKVRSAYSNSATCVIDQLCLVRVAWTCKDSRWTFCLTAHGNK